MLLGWYSLQEIRRRPGRTLLTLLGLALGVAVWVAAGATSPLAHGSYRDLFDRVAGARSLEVVTADQAGFDASWANRLLAVPGVSGVEQRIVVGTSLSVGTRVGRGSISVLALGLERAAVEQANLEVTTGSPFGPGEGVWLDERLATAANVPGSTMGCLPGQEVELWTPGGLERLPIRGLIRVCGLAALANVPILCLPLDQARQLFHLPGRVNSVRVRLAEDADLAATQTRLSLHVPAGLTIREPGARADSASATLHSASLALDALALIALAVAGFVMLNTFLLNLSERRGRLALLHVLGATRAQVRRLLLVEALGLGLLGSLLGLPAGVLLWRALLGVIGRWGIEVPSAALPLSVAVVGLLAGPVLAVVAVLVALSRSDRCSPLDALHKQRPGSSPATNWALTLIGAGAALATGTLLFALGSPGLPACFQSSALIGPAVALGLVGCVLALPLWTRSVLAVASSWLRGRLAPEYEFALHQLARRLPRTNLTVGMFFIAAASATAFGHSLTNTLADLRRWYERTIVADFLIRGSKPDGGFLLTAPLPDSLGAELARLPGVDRVERISFLSAKANEQSAMLLARTFSPDADLPLDLRTDRPEAVRERLAAGEAVIGTALARRLHLRVGDSLTVGSAAGPRQLRIAATVTEYAAGGQVIYLDWQTAHRLFEFEGVHIFLTSLRRDASSADRDRLEQFCTEQGLLSQSNADLREFIERLLGRVAALVWVLLALAFLIAALGIVNTLAMNILDQAHDLNILRALGMTRGRIKRSIVCQGLLLVTLSSWPGAAVGAGLAFLLNQASGRSCGQEVHFHIQPLQIVGCLALAYLIGFLASLLPTRSKDASRTGEASRPSSGPR